MTGPSRRVQRFEKELRQLSAEYVTMGLKVPLQNFSSVTRVQVSSDLRNAKVFVHLSGEPELVTEDLEELQFQAPALQQYVHSKLRSRYCPKIQFLEDKSYEHVLKVEKILHEISLQNSSNSKSTENEESNEP